MAVFVPDANLIVDTLSFLISFQAGGLILDLYHFVYLLDYPVIVPRYFPLPSKKPMIIIDDLLSVQSNQSFSWRAVSSPTKTDVLCRCFFS
jgi:hypothetical protein